MSAVARSSREQLPDRSCLQGMNDDASHNRERARHARELAEKTWQPELEDILRRVAREFDEAAESGAADAPKDGFLDRSSTR
jgi:hypothetical protein